MKELDVVRMKEAYGNIPKGEKGTIVHVYTNEPGVVEVEFSNRERFEEVETVPVGKLEKEYHMAKYKPVRSEIDRGAVVVFKSETRYSELGVVYERRVLNTSKLGCPNLRTPMAQVMVDGGVVWVPMKDLERIDYDGTLMLDLARERRERV